MILPRHQSFTVKCFFRFFPQFSGFYVFYNTNSDTIAKVNGPLLCSKYCEYFTTFCPRYYQKSLSLSVFTLVSIWCTRFFQRDKASTGSLSCIKIIISLHFHLKIIFTHSERSRTDYRAKFWLSRYITIGESPLSQYHYYITMHHETITIYKL